MSCCSPHKKNNNDEQKQPTSSCCNTQEQKPQKAASSCCAPQEEKYQSTSSSCCQTKEEASDKNSSSCCATEPKTIHRQMTIEEILGMFPQKAQRLSQEITNAGLSCVGCQAAVWETLEGGMYSHGKTDAQIDELVRRLNALLQEKIDVTSIQLTPRAAAKFLSILEEEGKQGWGLRFDEEMAGCNGFEYVLDFSEKADPDDSVFLSQGIEIHVKKKKKNLIGSTIDWVESLRGGTGFKIDNPNVGSSCACSSSHNYHN